MNVGKYWLVALKEFHHLLVFFKKMTIVLQLDSEFVNLTNQHDKEIPAILKTYNTSMVRESPLPINIDNTLHLGMVT